MENSFLHIKASESLWELRSFLPACAPAGSHTFGWHWCLLQWTAPAAAAANVSYIGQPLLPLLAGACSGGQLLLPWWWYLDLWTAPAATATNGLAATGSGLHSSLSFDCSVRTGQNRVTWKSPQQRSIRFLQEPVAVLAFLHSPHLNAGMKRYECGRN